MIRYAEILPFLTEILTEIVLPKNWTETAIRRYRFTGSRQTFTIPNTRGLNFNVRSDGSYYEWRMMKDGQTFKCHIGSVHELSLEQAKEKARRFRQNVKSGLPPQRDEVSSKDLMFQDLYAAYIASSEFSSRKPSYQEVFKYRIEKYAASPVGEKQLNNASDQSKKELNKNKLSSIYISAIDERIARQFWASVKDASNPHVAKAIKSHCKTIIDWAMQDLGCDLPTNPFNFSIPRTSKQQRQNIFSDGHLEQLIQLFQSEQQPKRQFLLCSLLTGWRNGELAKMKWDQIEYDVAVPKTNRKVAIWNAPADILKSNRNTRFVLTRRFISQIHELPQISDYVFSYGNTGAGGDALPMTPPTKRVRHIMCKIGLSEGYSLHTLRHTLVTRLKELDVPAANIDRFLGKTVREGSSSHTTYAHSDSLNSKLTVAMEWEKHLISLGFGGLHD